MPPKELVQILNSIRKDCIERACKACPCKLNEKDCLLAHTWPQNWLLPKEEDA